MSFTRFHDDPCRIIKQNQQMTDQGRYYLNVPGNGPNPCYMEDPQIISQKWGGNLWSNPTDVQSNLRGLNQPLKKRDCIPEKKNNFNIDLGKIFDLGINKVENMYPVCSSLTTEQSRVTNPAFLYKDLEQVNWYYLPLDPQENIFLPFQNNLNTRVLERDYFQRPTMNDCLLPETEGKVPTNLINPSYVGGPKICGPNGSCSKMI